VSLRRKATSRVWDLTERFHQHEYMVIRWRLASSFIRLLQICSILCVVQVFSRLASFLNTRSIPPLFTQHSVRQHAFTQFSEQTSLTTSKR
jgi:hypothetical protein